jgi:CheY-like chemotaxis protein
MPSICFPSPTVLVIDDSHELRDFLALLLTDEGYNVTTAASLHEARTALGNRLPDLVIADAYLPDGEPFAVLDLLAADDATCDQPLVFCTGAVMEVEEVQARLDAARAEVILKPFDVDALLTAVARNCRQPASR